MYVYTIIITICKVGAIWARRTVVRKTFQSISTVVFMIMVIEINNKKTLAQESYERKKNREIYGKSGGSPRQN